MLDGGTTVERSCHTMKRGSLQVRRGGDDETDNFPSGGIATLRNTDGKYANVNTRAEFCCFEV